MQRNAFVVSLAAVLFTWTPCQKAMNQQQQPQIATLFSYGNNQSAFVSHTQTQNTSVLHVHLPLQQYAQCLSRYQTFRAQQQTTLHPVQQRQQGPESQTMRQQLQQKQPTPKPNPKEENSLSSFQQKQSSPAQKISSDSYPDDSFLYGRNKPYKKDVLVFYLDKKHSINESAPDPLEEPEEIDLEKKYSDQNNPNTQQAPSQ